MKKRFFPLVFSSLLMLGAASCASSTTESNTDDTTSPATEERDLSRAENSALRKVKSELKRQNDVLQSYEIVECELPPCLLTEEFKSFRDAVNKVHIDIRTNQTRGLQQAVEKSQAKLAEIQNKIMQRVAIYDQETAGNKYMAILVKALQKNSAGDMPVRVIAIYEINGNEKISWIPVTEAVVNNAVMIENARAGQLSQYGFNCGQDLSALAATSSNPITKFILEN